MNFEKVFFLGIKQKRRQRETEWWFWNRYQEHITIKFLRIHRAFCFEHDADKEKVSTLCTRVTIRIHIVKYIYLCMTFVLYICFCFCFSFFAKRLLRIKYVSIGYSTIGKGSMDSYFGIRLRLMESIRKLEIRIWLQINNERKSKSRRRGKW